MSNRRLVELELQVKALERKVREQGHRADEAEARMSAFLEPLREWAAPGGDPLALGAVLSRAVEAADQASLRAAEAENARKLAR